MRSWDDDPDAANKSEHKGILEAYNWSQGTIITPVLVNNHSVFILKASQWFHFHVFYPDYFDHPIQSFSVPHNVNNLTDYHNFKFCDFFKSRKVLPIENSSAYTPTFQSDHKKTVTLFPSTSTRFEKQGRLDVIKIGFDQWESRLHSNRPITGLETDFKSIFDEQGDTITISEDAGCCERLLQIK